jgi:hypothetical protein
MGAGDSSHSNPGGLEEGGGGTNDSFFRRRERRSEEARRQGGKREQWSPVCARAALWVEIQANPLVLVVVVSALLILSFASESTERKFARVFVAIGAVTMGATTARRADCMSNGGGDNGGARGGAKMAADAWLPQTAVARDSNRGCNVGSEGGQKQQQRMCGFCQ